MVGHQGGDMDVPAVLGSGFSESFEEEAVVIAGEEDGLAAIAANPVVVEGTGELDPSLAEHL